MEFPVLPIEPLEVYVVPDDLHDLYGIDEVVHFAPHGDYRRGVSSDLAFLENSRRRRDYMARIRHRRRAYVSLADGAYLWNFEKKGYEPAPDADAVIDSLPVVDAVQTILYLPEEKLPPRWRVTAIVAGRLVVQEIFYTAATGRWAAGAISSAEDRVVIERWSTNHCIRHLQNQWLQHVDVQTAVLTVMGAS